MSWQRFVAAFDVHGDQQDPEAVAAFFKFLPKWKPTIRIMGGDLWDFRPLRKKANEDERRESMKTDFESGMEFLKRYSPTKFLRGNHDERLWELAEADRGVESDFAAQGVGEITRELRRHNCDMLPYHKRDGVLRVGHLKVIHGFFAGIYAARQTALVYGSTIAGHVHAIDSHAIAGLERRVARLAGCLARLDMEYSNRQPNSLRHAHGWIFGVVNQRSGAFHLWQAEQISGKWLVPTDVAEL
jgi:hypothetical protein